MKKNLLLSALFLIGGLFPVHGQNDNIEILHGPEYIESACDNGIFMSGVSENGRYCWGYVQMTAYYCDMETGEYAVIKATDEELNEGYVESRIAGITNDGMAIINYGSRETYTLNIATGDKTYLTSPLEDYPYINIWDMSLDGSVITGNFINAGNKQHPMFGVRQDDGTYKLTPLEYDKLDAIGDIAQFTQVRKVTSDGKYLAGSQIDCSGSFARFVVWKLGEDGNYEFTTPMDEILYDYSYEKPGKQPVMSDYVTCKDKTSDEYKSQCKEYNKAVNDWLDKCYYFTRGGMTTEWGGLDKSSRGDWLCCSLRVPDSDYVLRFRPIFYDCENDKIVTMDELDKENKGAEVLNDNTFLTMEGPAGVWFKLMIVENGNKRPFHEWLKEKSGLDVSETYHFKFKDKNTWKNVDDIFMGKPEISYDGKTMILSTSNKGAFRASVIKFDRSIYGDVETGINAEVVGSFDVTGSEIEGNADVEVYTFDGKKIKTIHVSGSTDLNGVLDSGSYIIKVISDNNVTRSFKLILG